MSPLVSPLSPAVPTPQLRDGTNSTPQRPPAPPSRCLSAVLYRMVLFPTQNDVLFCENKGLGGSKELLWLQQEPGIS